MDVRLSPQTCHDSKDHLQATAAVICSSRHRIPPEQALCDLVVDQAVARADTTQPCTGHVSVTLPVMTHHEADLRLMEPADSRCAPLPPGAADARRMLPFGGGTEEPEVIDGRRRLAMLLPAEVLRVESPRGRTSRKLSGAFS